jgi:excisionase family DNA binding protein
MDKQIQPIRRDAQSRMFYESRRSVDTAGVGDMQKQANTNISRLLTETEACEYLRVRPRQLFNWRMSGLVPFIRIGRAIRFRVTDLDAAIDRMTINPIQPDRL